MQKYPTSSQSGDKPMAPTVSRLKDIAFAALTKQGIFRIELPETTSPEHQQNITSVLENMITSNLLPKFLLAVMDDKRDEVRAILDVNPEVLLFTPPANLIIESQLSHHQLYAEDALSMACKRKQLEMVKIILPHFEKLLAQADTEEEKQSIIQIRAKALAAWKPYELHKNNQGEDEIVIPDGYVNDAQSLINVFKAEDFPHGFEDAKGNFNFTQLSEETELALKTLFSILLPKQAVKLDDYLDVDLFLLATYKAIYDSWTDANFSYEQKSAFCVRVIGLVQRALTPETAKIFCEGLYDVVERQAQISERAKSLRLRDGGAFYPSGAGDLAGLGFDFCASLGRRELGPASIVCTSGSQFFGTLMSNKNNSIWSITQRLQRRQQPSQRPANPNSEPLSCVIL